MTALTIPPEVAADCAEKLLALAALASRDSMTLTKQALILARNETPSKAFATLKKYVREYNQYESGEVAKIIAAIEAAADPEHMKRLARRQAKYDAQRAEFEKDTDQMMPLAHAAIREQEASPGLIAAVIDFHEGTGSLGDVRANMPGGRIEYAAELAVTQLAEIREREEALKHQGGNVLPGPWGAAGRTGP